MSNLYIVGSKSGDPIKIGVSTNPKNRLMGIQTGYHSKLVIVKTWKLHPENAYRIERLAHAALDKYRLCGEWFSCSHEEALMEIDDIMKNTKNGRSVNYYEGSFKETIYNSVKSRANQINGQKSADLQKARSKKCADKIADRWPMPSKEWRTEDLLNEAGISLNTAKAHLGKRPIAQYNYQAKKKRKERNAKN